MNPANTGGRLVYAVGDIHGRLDLLQRLTREIAADALGSEFDGRPILIFLGDYVDRGPDSKGVIDYIVRLRGELGFDVHCLKGDQSRPC